MRICMLIEAWKPIWAGGQVHVWELCKGLVRHNHEIDLYVMNLDGIKEETFFNGKLKIIRIGNKTRFNFPSRIKWCYDVINEASKKKYDVVHAHANLPGIPGKIIAKKLGIPIIYTVHGSGIEAMKEMYGSLNGSLLYLIETFVQRKIKYNKEISVDSRFLKYKNVNKGISVIPNGVDIKKFDSISAKKSNKFKVIFVGRLHPQKGVKYLIEAISKIKDKINNVEISIVGSGEEEQKLKGLSKNLGVSDIIKFKGKLFGSDLVKEYKSSHLFVLPSLYEGQPLTLLEAWAAKLPVLVTSTGDNDKFVKNSINGFTVPPKNVSLLSINLLKIIGLDKQNLDKMGENGYRLVKGDYTWEKMVEKVDNIYENAGKIK